MTIASPAGRAVENLTGLSIPSAGTDGEIFAIVPASH